MPPFPADAHIVVRAWAVGALAFLGAGMLNQVLVAVHTSRQFQSPSRSDRF